MGRHRECSTILTNKHTVTSAGVTPINPVLLRDGLKLGNLPVERIAPHGDEQLRCRVHSFKWYYRQHQICKLFGTEQVNDEPDSVLHPW